MTKHIGESAHAQSQFSYYERSLNPATDCICKVSNDTVNLRMTGMRLNE